MRTTVDLPPYVRHRAEQIARERGQSLSSVISELTALGLAQVDQPDLEIDPLTGIPLFRIGRTITAEDVAAFLDEDE
jgi:hypothetical protein